MDRLTKEQIELMCESAIGLDSNKTERLWTRLKAEALRDLALQSISQEAVRDEVLEEALRFYAGEVDGQHWGEAMLEDGGRRAKAALVALKREPNAAGTQGISGKSLGVMETLVAPLKTEPAPAAPNVGGCHVCSGPALKFGTGCALTNCPYRTAPDVASMVKRLRDCCAMIGYATSGAERASHKRNADAAEAALLAKLGQGSSVEGRKS